MQNHGALQQEYLSGLPRPPPGHLLDPEIEATPSPPPNDTNALIYKTEKDPQTWKTNLWFAKGTEGVGGL